jgi:hypothetical protein
MSKCNDEISDFCRLLAGHYTCYAYNEEKGAWINFNDSRVHVVTPEEVATSQAYMLFYERNDTFTRRIVPLLPKDDSSSQLDRDESRTKDKSKKRPHPDDTSNENVSSSSATTKVSHPRKKTKR